MAGPGSGNPEAGLGRSRQLDRGGIPTRSRREDVIERTFRRHSRRHGGGALAGPAARVAASTTGGQARGPVAPDRRGRGGRPAARRRRRRGPRRAPRRPRRLLRQRRGAEGPEPAGPPAAGRWGRQPRRGELGLLRGARLRLPQRHADGAGQAAVPGGGRDPTGLRQLPGLLQAGDARLAERHAADRAAGAGRGLPRRPRRPPAARRRRRDRQAAARPGAGGDRADLTIGVAGSKFLAKLASTRGKPDGLFVVPPSRSLEFLHPLPAEALWGVGPATIATLARYGLRTVGDVARTPRETLERVLGAAVGAQLAELAWARDDRPVVP